MKYQLKSKGNDSNKILHYVKRIMREQKFTSTDVKNYVNNALAEGYINLMYYSQGMVDLCNKRSNA